MDSAIDPSRYFPPFSLLSRNTEAPGAHFSKVPKRFGRISGDIVFFVSSNEGVSIHETLQLF